MFVGPVLIRLAAFLTNDQMLLVVARVVPVLIRLPTLLSIIQVLLVVTSGGPSLNTTANFPHTCSSVASCENFFCLTNID